MKMLIRQVLTSPRAWLCLTDWNFALLIFPFAFCGFSSQSDLKYVSRFFLDINILKLQVLTSNDAIQLFIDI